MSSTEASESVGGPGARAVEPRAEAASDLAAAIGGALRDYPDFPRPGILFRDIAPVLADPALLRRVTRELARHTGDADARIVAGIESRGFLFGACVAHELGLPFVPVRKRGKLPGDTVTAEYELEYGTAHLELQRNAVGSGERVMLIDDLLATGGTAVAAAGLVERLGGRVVGMAFLVELDALRGRDALRDYNIMSLLRL